MISTLQIKQQQLANTFFKSGSGAEKILIMGSCRVAPLVWYFEKWNEENGNEFTIYSIDPFSWNWDLQEQRTDYAAILNQLETDERLLTMLQSVDLFIHEFYSNSGLFNTVKTDGKNIYKFGLSPRVDICTPNWNDVFVLFSDIVSFDLDLRKKAIQDFNVIGKLSEQTQKEIFDKSKLSLNKFYWICSQSDLPEMAQYFKDTFTQQRLWWTFNHVSKHFTLKIFDLINEKYLHLLWSAKFWFDINQEDMFANNYTHLTEYDIKHYGYEWGEELIDLRSKL